MKVKTHVKAGFDLGHEVNRAAHNIAHGAQNALNGVGRVTVPVVKEAGRIVTDPKFWTWPFGSNS